MHFTNYYKQNTPIFFDTTKRCSDDEVFNRLKPYIGRKIFFYFDFDKEVLIYNEYELRVCCRIYSIWHNSHAEQSFEPDIVEYGFDTGMKDVFNISRDHFSCSLFPPLRLTVPVIKECCQEDIEESSLLKDEEYIPFCSDPPDPPLYPDPPLSEPEIFYDASAEPSEDPLFKEDLEKPDWCSNGDDGMMFHLHLDSGDEEIPDFKAQNKGDPHKSAGNMPCHPEKEELKAGPKTRSSRSVTLKTNKKRARGGL